jgi:hypothetical protein
MLASTSALELQLSHCAAATQRFQQLKLMTQTLLFSKQQLSLSLDLEADALTKS